MIAVCSQMLSPQSSVRNIHKENEIAGLPQNSALLYDADAYPSNRYNVRSRYEFLKTLGKGTYGKVKLAIEKDTGKKFAVKTIRKDRIKEKDDMKHIKREMKIMSSLHHPNITQIHEVFENQDKIVIVMEYAPKGELYDHLCDKKISGELEACLFFKQITSAVLYCHERGVVHRDLKLENILLGENYEIKIADFGLANMFKSDQLLQTFCGSPLYASPEIVNGIKYVGPEVDSWSLGVLLYALVYGMMPFDGSDHKTLNYQITHGEYSKQNKYPDADDLISQLLTVDPAKRANIHQVANHRWLSRAKPCVVAMTPPPVFIPSDLKPRAVDTNANYLNAMLPVENVVQPALIAPTLLPVVTSPDHNEVNYPRPPFPQPKSILKRNTVPQPFDSVGLFPTITEVPASHQVASGDSDSMWQTSTTQQPGLYVCSNTQYMAVKEAACGLQAKDSLKLKAKPLGASGKRRVLKSKKDRESGYYSSPERTPVDVQSLNGPTSAFSFTPHMIKPPLMPNVMSDGVNMGPVRSPQNPSEPLLPVPNQFCTIPVTCPYILPMAPGNPPIPIIEGHPVSYFTEYVSTTVGVSNVYNQQLPVPYTIPLNRDDTSPRGSHRPISTYSDSSILSSDSFELCTFDNPLSCNQPLTATATSTVDTHLRIPLAPMPIMYTGIRPSTLPIPIPAPQPEAGRWSPPCSLNSEPSGSLTPTSAKLNQDLRRILGSNRPRKSRQRLQRHSAPPQAITDEQTNQLDEMMRQLNLDLEKAYENMTLTASTEV